MVVSTDWVVRLGCLVATLLFALTRAAVAVAAPAPPTITAASPVTAGATGLTASVTVQSGMTYSWTISGGTVTSAGGAAGVTSGTENTITYTAGSPGTLTLACVESDGLDPSSAPATQTITVVAAPTTPSIGTDDVVITGSTGNTASVTANPGMTYSWTISGGTITSAGGGAGVTVNGTNTLTYTAAPAGTVSLTCVEINAAGTVGTPANATVPISGSTDGSGSLFFFAHQDDDVLFANPAVEQRVQAGLPVRIVYLTAAGSPDTASWQARERGAYRSYIAMTGAVVIPWVDPATYWTRVQKTFAGKTVTIATFNLDPNVSIVFMRLPDGGLSSLWATDNGPPFYVAPASSLATADSTSSYTKADVIQTLAAIISDFQPGEIGTQDSTFAYGDDHPDHVASALFALEAERTYARPHRVRQFRGYNIDGNYFTIPAPEIANLSLPEYNEKTRITVAYAGGFPAGSDYDHWCQRHYAVSKMPGGTGPLVTSQGLCVAPWGGGAAPGTPVGLAAPTDSLAQRWTITNDGLVIGIGGLCLTVATDGSSLTIETPTASPRQRWTFFSNGQLRGFNGTCLTVANDGVTLLAALCGPDRSTNQWTVPANQRFVQQFSRPRPWSAGSDFADADVPPAATYSATLALADVNGDGYADACIRLPGGVYVALNNHAGGFGPYRLYSAAFSDAQGWQPDAYGSTLQFADVNGDGKADVIGRGPNGVVVALANADGSGFGSPTLWSSDFSDAAGFGAAASYYRTLRLADVNGDGYPDLCMRGPNGILVALNNGGAFAPATLWSTDFADAAGWLPDAYGTTIQFGDVNGDGLADVCGRGPAGVFCAISTGNSFVNYHQWTLRTDFSDAAGWGSSAAYYGSLRLADVNGDGLADVCGRGPNGIVCAISHGNGADRVLELMPREFTDARGWSAVPYGSSIRFGDLNRDGRADVIGRGPNGLIAALAPGSATESVVPPSPPPPPVTPTITATAPVKAGSIGNTASVTANPGMSYNWTITNGTITNADGAAGVIANGANTLTYTAGPAGSVLLTCVEMNAAGTVSAPASAIVPISGSTDGSGSLFFFAHQDDDLLFANPAIEQRIRAGLPVRVVFLTAAGSPDTASWQAREHGVYSAYIAMTGISVDPYADAASYWTRVQQTVAGKTLTIANCNLQPNVSVVFMRLPDGGLSSLWATDSGAPFFVRPASSLTTADGASSYTKADVIQTLAAIISDFQPGEIGTQDSTFAYGDDHQDHITSALFALEAEHTYPRPHHMRQFRGYNIDGNYFTIPAPEIANLAAPEYKEKTRVMAAYGGDFPAGSDYDHWSARHYAVSKMPGGTGPLVTSQGLCVAPWGGGAAPGTPVGLAAPTDSLAQRWTITNDGLVIGIGGLCLTVGADGTALTLETPTASPRQRWTFFSNGQLRGFNGTCLTVANDGVTLLAALCAADRSTNQWTVPANQRFVQQFAAPHLWSAGSDFTDAAVPAAATYSATLALADVNGDGYADACIRLPGGVYVALNNRTGGFGPYQLYSGAFSDAAGWQPEMYGSTLQFADVNGDGKADVIGRGPNGVVVALANANGSGFGSPTLWSRDFSDAAGFGAAASYYRTLRLADVNGDGYPDLCMRGPNGILVALNTRGGAFAPATLWNADFADTAGWLPDAYGTTIQFGDVNGDGLADVCGRGPAGVFCAISTGNSFVHYHQWTLRTDFSDAAGWGSSAAYYGSLRLADVNGDGLADVCGRGPNGIVCAISHGNGADRVLELMPREFTDALGWGTVPYGSSIRFGDLNGDGRADVLGRSPTGLVAALAP